jgi:hypothetical protein
VAAAKTVLLAQGVSTRARWMLEAFREGMAQLGTVYEGGDAPSSGFIGIYFLLQVCAPLPAPTAVTAGQDETVDETGMAHRMSVG